MRRVGGSGLRALVRIELLTVLRDRFMVVGVVFLMVMSAAFLPAVGGMQTSMGERSEDGTEAATVPDAPDDDHPPEGEGAVGEPCRQPLPSLAVEGEWPDGLHWPVALRTDGAADVWVRGAIDDEGIIELVVEGSDSAAEDVQACLEHALERARTERLAMLGMDDDPNDLVDIVNIGAEAPATEVVATRSDEPLALLAIYLVGLALVMAGSIALEAVPRRRASGLLEQLRSTQTDEVELVLAWLVSIVLITSGILLACGFVALGSGWLLGGAPAGEMGPLVHLPSLVVLVAAASIGTSLKAQDVQAATIRWMLLMVAFLVGNVVSGMTYADRPWFAALMPFGGASLASVGLLGGWSGALASVASLGWSALVVVGCGWSLANEESATAGVDPALARRARGNYLPEVGVLTVFGVCNAVMAGTAVFGGGFWGGATFAFVTFMLVPSVLAGPVLGIRSLHLLPLGRPRLGNLALAVPMAAGLMVLGQGTVALTMELFPKSVVIDRVMEGLGQVPMGLFGQLAIGLYPAVCEEFLYRGVIYGLLLRSGRPWLANLGQAVAFSLAHLVSVRLPWTFVMGLFLGWIRARTGSLWACMALHFVFNTSSAALTVWAGSDAQPSGSELVWALPLLLLLGLAPFYRRQDVRAASATQARDRSE